MRRAGLAETAQDDPPERRPVLESLHGRHRDLGGGIAIDAGGDRRKGDAGEPVRAGERQAAITGSVIYGHYEKLVDRESAYELLRAQAAGAAARTEAQASKAAEAQQGGGLNDMLFGSTGPRGGQRDGLLQIAAKTMTRTIGSSIGRQIVRGILGSLLGGRR